MTALLIIKFGSNRVKTGSSVLKFPFSYSSVLTTISKWHKIFKFLADCQKSNGLYPLPTNIRTIKTCLKLNKTVGAVGLYYNIGNLS